MMCNQTFSSLLIKHWFKSMRRWLGRKNGFNYVLSQLENQSKSLNPLLGTLKFIPYSLSLTRYVFRWFHHRQQTNKLISIRSISLIRSISFINSRHFFSPEGRRVNHIDMTSEYAQGINQVQYMTSQAKSIPILID